MHACIHAMHLPLELLERILITEGSIIGKTIVRSISSHFYNLTEVKDTRWAIASEVAVSLSEMLKTFEGSYISIANELIVDSDSQLIADVIYDILINEHYRFEISFHHNSPDSTSFFALCDTCKRYVLHAMMSLARATSTTCVGSAACFEPITVTAPVAADVLLEFVFNDELTLWQETCVVAITDGCELQVSI